MTFDIKATATMGADIIKADKLGSIFTSRVVGSFAEATSAEATASDRYDHLVSEENYVPSELVSPTRTNVMDGKSTADKDSWADLQTLARAIKWTPEEKQFWKDTNGDVKTMDAKVKATRDALSTRASNLITKTWFKGIYNAHKRANPDLYKRAASTTRDAQTKVLDAIAIGIKAIQDMKDADESIFDANETLVALQAAKKEANRKS
jgi:hypothetical protein